MCFGSSKPKTTEPPAPQPPTTFSYRAGADSLKQQQQAAQSQPQAPSFGSELGTSTTSPMPATY